MTSSLVGSEMCIRDRECKFEHAQRGEERKPSTSSTATATAVRVMRGGEATVSYTHLTLPTICSV
eukprot:8867511-Prorocentrum_lima.AAC.1